VELPRTSIAGMMAAVAVVAFDCFVLIMTDGGGVLLVGLTLTVGFVCWWRGRGKGRRFWLGFEVAGIAAVLAYTSIIQTDDGLIAQWPMYLLNLGLARSSYVVDLWNFLAADNSQAAPLALFEMSYGLPMLLIAAIGGLVAALIGPLRKAKHSAVD
jgi:hypothetical protein